MDGTMGTNGLIHPAVTENGANLFSKSVVRVSYFFPNIFPLKNSGS